MLIWKLAGGRAAGGWGEKENGRRWQEKWQQGGGWSGWAADAAVRLRPPDKQKNKKNRNSIVPVVCHLITHRRRSPHQGCRTLTSVQSNRSGAGHTESAARPSTATKSSGHIIARLSFHRLHLYNVPDLTNDIYFAIDSSRVLLPVGEDLLLSSVPRPFCEDARKGKEKWCPRLRLEPSEQSNTASMAQREKLPWGLPTEIIRYCSVRCLYQIKRQSIQWTLIKLSTASGTLTFQFWKLDYPSCELPTWAC